jgi:plastocyanin
MSKSQVRSKFPRFLVAASCLLIATATACGGGDKSTPSSQSTATASATGAPSTASSAPASAAQIVIEGMRFGDKLTVPPGAQVSVINKDSAEHTVTSDTAGAFDAEVQGNKQATFSAPTTPGSYPFHCTYHPSMHGVLVVQ